MCSRQLDLKVVMEGKQALISCAVSTQRAKEIMHNTQWSPSVDCNHCILFIFYLFFTFRIVPLGYLFVSSVSSVIWSRLRVRNKKVTDRRLGHTIGGAFAVSRVPAFHPHKSELVCFLLLLQRLVMWFSDEMLISCFAEHIKWS